MFHVKLAISDDVSRETSCHNAQRHCGQPSSFVSMQRLQAQRLRGALGATGDLPILSALVPYGVLLLFARSRCPVHRRQRCSGEPHLAPTAKATTELTV
ncbi:hypothetical protein AHiyo6_04280 [Arthrobacter sp. Hiyo6]|nr:hypothetical protein AHiyo6_04280 [Arthrobacter sp. Hiyo6]